MASWVKFEIDGCTLTFQQRLFMGLKSNIIENVNLKKTELRVGDFFWQSSSLKLKTMCVSLEGQLVKFLEIVLCYNPTEFTH